MKKIIAIVAVIATITAILCIGASATNGLTLQDGTVITFKNTINLYENGEQKYINLNFVSRSVNNYNQISLNDSWLSYKNSNGGTLETVYNYSSNVWSRNDYKTITISGTQTIIDNDFIEWLYSNTSSGLPERTIEKTLSNTKATFSTTLTVATAIIAWLVANQLALVGLYMYILITLALIGKRYIKGA